MKLIIFNILWLIAVIKQPAHVNHIRCYSGTIAYINGNLALVNGCLMAISAKGHYTGEQIEICCDTHNQHNRLND